MAKAVKQRVNSWGPHWTKEATHSRKRSLGDNKAPGNTKPPRAWQHKTARRSTNGISGQQGWERTSCDTRHKTRSTSATTPHSTRLLVCESQQKLVQSHDPRKAVDMCRHWRTTRAKSQASKPAVQEWVPCMTRPPVKRSMQGEAAHS
jgi:hypothetical protein